MWAAANRRAGARPTVTRRHVQPTRRATGIRIKTSARRPRQRPKPKLPPRKRRPLRRQPRHRLLRPKLPRRHSQNRHRRKPLILRLWLLPLQIINRLEGVGFGRPGGWPGTEDGRRHPLDTAAPSLQRGANAHRGQLLDRVASARPDGEVTARLTSVYGFLTGSVPPTCFRRQASAPSEP